MRSKAERIMETKAAFEEYLTLFDDREDGKALICRTAARLIRVDGMRGWSTNTFSLETSALSSLNYLLGEKICSSNGRSYTGGNASWVLDIWERSLEALHFATEREPFHSAYTRVSEETKAKLVAKVKPLTIGMQVINAFVARDEDAIMKLALELDS